MGETDIFSNHSERDFCNLALDIFRYQAKYCLVYQQYLTSLSINVADINTIEKIPFLPIEFFKSHIIMAEGRVEEQVFSSSGTTGSIPSRHFISDISVYEESFQKGFFLFYGLPQPYAILALLPSYQERSGSSLIYMVNDLIKQSKVTESGYFLYNHDDLFRQLKSLKHQKVPTILIGVSYALLDFVEHYRIEFPELIVMETGGMKGKRREMIRAELHQVLSEGFGVSTIHAEYGMTELLSQAYSKGNGMFNCPPWMKVLIRELNDPFSYVKQGQTGGINVIDLANINSCSFIATQDLGRTSSPNQFEVLGRFDQSDVRGCNLMVQ